MKHTLPFFEIDFLKNLKPISLKTREVRTQILGIYLPKNLKSISLKTWGSPDSNREEVL